MRDVRLIELGHPLRIFRPLRETRAMRRELHEWDGRNGRVAEVEMLAERVVECHCTTLDRDCEYSPVSTS